MPCCLSLLNVKAAPDASQAPRHCSPGALLERPYRQGLLFQQEHSLLVDLRKLSHCCVMRVLIACAGSLVKLDMTQMGLFCEFPYQEMQAFKSLTSISFLGNGITGDVEMIGQSLRGLFGQLTYLDLSFNSVNGSFAGNCSV